MNILITGISGFIGRSLVKMIIDNHYPIKIYGIDINDLVIDYKYRNLVTFAKLDIRSADSVKKYFESHVFNGVIHLAAVSRVAVAETDKLNCVETNFLGTENIVKSIDPNTWIIFASSREVYGEPETLPVRETDLPNPMNIYGESKLKAEECIRKFVKKYVIFRFSNVYGNEFDLDGRVIPNFVKKAMNNEPVVIEGGDQIIDFTYIDDTVNSILKAVSLLQSDEVTNDTIHLSPGKGNSLRTLITHIELLLDKNVNVIIKEKRNYDVVKFIGDPEHRISVLGNIKYKSLYEGLEIYVEKLKSK